VVDFDVGLRNLDLVMGAERRVVHDLINVVQGVVKLAPALIWAGSITKCNTFLAGCCDGNQLRAFDGRGACDADGDAGGWVASSACHSLF
jgi:hypothetical protein